LRTTAALAGALALAFIVHVPRDARADEPAKPAPAETKQTIARPWSISAGLGYTAFMGGFAGSIALPIGGLFTAERHLVGPLSLMGRVSVTYAHSALTQTPTPGVSGSDSLTADSVFARAGLGAKLSFGSLDAIQIAPFILVDGSYGWSAVAQSSANSKAIGAELGFAIDRDIVPGFGIRLSAVVASLSHAWSFAVYDDVPAGISPQQESAATVFELGFEPAAELRWSF
jgi:hypothetical protein